MSDGPSPACSALPSTEPSAGRTESGFAPLEAPPAPASERGVGAKRPTGVRVQRKYTLAARFTRLSLGAVTLALLVAGSLLNGAMFIIQRNAMQDEVTAQARVIAGNALATLLFTDSGAAQETLATLERSPRVARATLYAADGAPFADYRRRGPENAQGDAALPALGPAGAETSRHQLVVVEPVQGANGTAGWLRVQAPLAPLYREATVFGAVTAASAALALLLAWLLAVGLRRDVSRVERRLDDLAYLDPVTRLFNRHAATEHLEEYSLQATAQGTGYSVVSVDLDNFKAINDTLGHHIGDEVLREVAARLSRALRPGARAYRFGGDEFVVICPCEEGLQDPMRYGHLIRTALAGVLHIEGIEISLSGSVGVSRFPHDGSSAEQVLLASDMAMYRAKTRGKNSISVFDASLREASENRLRVESDLRLALRDQQFVLHYQPIVELVSGRVVGAEALVRWQHPERGLLGPMEFVGVAEQSGLVVPMGGWVLSEAARQLAHWHAHGLQGLRLAVNVSARQLRGGRLRDQFWDAISRAGGDPATFGLEIELTEHTLVEDLDENLALLRELRQAGVHVAVDDFGTGLSSLSYLKRLPIDKLKIDRSFITGLASDVGDRAIVTAALAMAKSLGLTVVAEGVETPAQRAALQALGCDLAQGWLFGKPQPPDVFEQLALQSRAGSPLARAAAEPA